MDSLIYSLSVPLAYEGYLILGRLKEAFWIEGFGNIKKREEMFVKVTEMAESL